MCVLYPFLTQIKISIKDVSAQFLKEMRSSNNIISIIKPFVFYSKKICIYLYYCERIFKIHFDLSIKIDNYKYAWDKLQLQQFVFGNPRLINPDKVFAFQSNVFKTYCKQENIIHITIITSLPRRIGHVISTHDTLFPLLNKPSFKDPPKKS